MTNDSKAAPDQPAGDAWDAYWADGRLAACLRDQQGNYGGVIAQAWGAFFEPLADGTRILDIATGNGAVALLAVAAAVENGKSFELHAADAAQIDPLTSLSDRSLQLNQITFHSHVAAESLPFEAESFDAVTAQYGLEYADWTQAVTEVARVLAPAGRCQFICHCTDSSVYRTTQGQLHEIAQVQVQDLTGGLSALLQAKPQQLADVRRQFDQRAARVMQQLNRSQGADRVFISDYLQRLGEIFKHRSQHGPEHSLQQTKELELDLQRHAARLQALRSAALGPDDIVALNAALENTGLMVEASEPLRDSAQGDVLGHRVQASKAAADG